MYTGYYAYTKEMIDYKLKMIESFFGEKPENDDEETQVMFIKEREEKLRNAIDSTFDLMNKVYNSRAFEFTDETLGISEIIVADKKEDALKLFIETTEAIMLELSTELKIQELDIFKEEMIVDIDFVPENDRNAWSPVQNDDKLLIVPLVYCIDYILSEQPKEMPFFLV